MIDQGLKTWPFIPLNRGNTVWGGSLCFNNADNGLVSEVCEKVKLRLPTIICMVRPQI